MDQYRLEKEKGNGTFSVVFEAQSVKTGKRVAIKCMKNKFSSVNKVRNLKEIQALTFLSHHENVVKLIEVLYDEPTGKVASDIGKLALVFELMDMNLYEYLKGHRNITMSRIKHIMFQVLKAIEAMHKKGIFHRDIKPQNILISGDVAKLADLGSCRRNFINYLSGYQSPQPYTDYISTRWYRAPECLMTDGYYNEKMDMWGFGCVLFELITKYPLFPGKDQLDQVHRIHHILGTPSEEILNNFRQLSSHMEINFPQKKGKGLDKLLPNVTPDVKDILKKLLQYDAETRISAQDALKHDFFSQVYSSSASLNTKDYFRSTFFTVKQPTKDKSDEERHQKIMAQSGIGASLGKPKKNNGSRNNLQKLQETVLPKLGYDKSNQPQRKSHTKKISLDFNLTLMAHRKAF